jgi:hypothetical protein
MQMSFFRSIQMASDCSMPYSGSIRMNAGQNTEDAPFGLILCSAKHEEQIELLPLNRGEIRVAEYLTALPAKKILAAKLQDAVIRVREQLARARTWIRRDVHRSELPRLLQHRILFYGTMGALVFRGLFIVLGAVRLQYGWAVILFGVFLMLTASR